MSNSENGQSNGNGNGGLSEGRAAASTNKDSENGLNGVSARVEGVERKTKEVYTTVRQEAQAYYEKGKHAVESAKEVVADIHQKTQPYLDQAKQTTASCVDGARQAVEKVQAVKRGVDKKVEEASSFDVTKTAFFVNAVLLTATALAFVWRCVQSISCAKRIASTALAKMEAVELPDKLWWACYYAGVVLEHIPVIGYRTTEIVRIFAEQVTDECRKQIRFSQTEADTKKAS